MDKINYEEIDEEIRPLIKELNKTGLKTTGSCSGHNKDTAYINIRLENIHGVRVNNIHIKGQKHLQIEWELKKNELA